MHMAYQSVQCCRSGSSNLLICAINHLIYHHHAMILFLTRNKLKKQNVNPSFTAFTHVVRCAPAQQSASQLSNDTTNRQFRVAILGSHRRDGANTTCRVERSSTRLLRTSPAQSGVSAAQLGRDGFAGGFSAVKGEAPDRSQAQHAAPHNHPRGNARAAPKDMAKAEELLHMDNSVDQTHAHGADSPCMQIAECNRNQMITASSQRDSIQDGHAHQSLTPPLPPMCLISPACVQAHTVIKRSRSNCAHRAPTTPAVGGISEGAGVNPDRTVDPLPRETHARRNAHLHGSKRTRK